MRSYYNSVELLAEWIASSRRLCVFTGAGISCPSGIPDFRSESGLYSTSYGSCSPEFILSHGFFENNTEEFFRFYREKMLYPEAKPNAAHRFFASLEDGVRDVCVVTQNIDGLHTAAGSTRVHELHGNVNRNICRICGRVFDLSFVTGSDEIIPRCPHDGGVLKPDVVLYDERLSDSVTREAAEDMADADTVVAVGTSLTVYPAAAFLDCYRGIRLAVINRAPTPLDARASVVLHEDIVRVTKDIEHILKKQQ